MNSNRVESLAVRGAKHAMQISDLEFYLLKLRSGGGGASGGTLLARLVSDAGVDGWGEAPLPWRPAELDERRNLLLPLLAGRNVFEIEDLLTLDLLADPPLVCALEMASWDLVGKGLGQPLCRLWGGSFRRRVPVRVRLELGDIRDAGQLARELAEQGVHHQLLALPQSRGFDFQQVHLICEASHERADFALDAGGHAGAATSADMLGELQRIGATLVVDPPNSDDLTELAKLRRQTSLPLGAWRGVRRPADVFAVAQAAAADRVILEPARLGGLQSTRRCVAVAEAAALHASLCVPCSAGPAIAAAVQLAAANPSLDSPLHTSYHLQQDDALAASLELLDGMITVPDGSGLGIEIDRAKLEALQSG